MITICVVGQGYVGLPLAIKAASAGYRVLGYDTDATKVLSLSQGLTNLPDIDYKEFKLLLDNGLYIPTIDPKLISTAQIIVIAVPTPLDKKGKPDTSILELAAEIVAKNASPKTLIINESTSYPGTLRNLISPIFVKNSKNIFLFASAPERVDPGNDKWNIKNTCRVIGGLTTEATNKCIKFYKSFCDEVFEVSNPEVAEASKLFENTFRMVNIALANEFAAIADKMEFSAFEAILAAATKPFGFMPFYPSIGVGGHCIPIDPQYLSYVAQLAGVESKLIDVAHEINLSMPHYSSQKIALALKNNLKNKKIQLAGIAYKPNIPDMRESPALDLISNLRRLGAVVSWHDPVVQNYNGEVSSSLTKDIDLGLIVTPHLEIDFSPWRESNLHVLDLSANSNNYGWPKFL